MKYLLSLFIILFSLISRGQNIYFLPDNFSAEYKYAESINKLAKELIPRYSKHDKAEYYNGLFRFYFASENYSSVL